MTGEWIALGVALSAIMLMLYVNVVKEGFESEKCQACRRRFNITSVYAKSSPTVLAQAKQKLDRCLKECA